MREKILFSGLIILFVLHTMAIAQVGENESYYDDRFYWGGLGGSVENLFEVDGELYMSGRFHTYRGDHSISDFLKWNGERWVSAGKKQNLDNTSFLFLYNDEIHKISYSDLDNNEGLTKWTGEEWEVVNSDNYYGWLRDTESFEGDLILGVLLIGLVIRI
ncbi:hypothetical protein [Gracilimonas mengyeensis]|uniref:Uncharacterized protein n=1 Tax=Gracilimonas mengyeensis TaxID=1302730 RepID=A0A521DCA3_9BACT|nr:hypothetical protein [Gracilimonas mengyeensis]SMO69329.1 hypothetical protein SAMN06265219_10832 [Gracilimonas mengyeensis]